MADVAVTHEVPKRRVEKRRRSQVIKLRLLPQEEERLRLAVAESGHPSIQAYLLAKLPEIATAS
jgi:hypothetical protein